MPDSWYNNTRKGCEDMELKALRISEKKAEVLHSMQIMRAEDLLTCYPFRYEHLEAKPRDTWEKEDRDRKSVV